MSTEEWERYIKELERLRKSDAPRQVTMPPYFGTVHSLGEQAAYFALHRFDTSTVAIIPFHATRGADGRESSYFRLYAAQ